jgi:hypothetical protein
MKTFLKKLTRIALIYILTQNYVLSISQSHADCSYRPYAYKKVIDQIKMWFLFAWESREKESNPRGNGDIENPGKHDEKPRLEIPQTNIESHEPQTTTFWMFY